MSYIVSDQKYLAGGSWPGANVEPVVVRAANRRSLSVGDAGGVDRLVGRIGPSPTTAICARKR